MIDSSIPDPANGHERDTTRPSHHHLAPRAPVVLCARGPSGERGNTHAEPRPVTVFADARRCCSRSSRRSRSALWPCRRPRPRRRRSSTSRPRSPTRLDPHTSILGQTQAIKRFMYRGLTRFAIKDGKVTTAEVEPDLAESWTLSPDGTRVDVQAQEGRAVPQGLRRADGRGRQVQLRPPDQPGAGHAVRREPRGDQVHRGRRPATRCRSR